MSSKTVFLCDHCGAECSGDEYVSIGRWEEPKAVIFGKYVHGCSKEHLGLGLAKLFGVGVDGKAIDLLNGKQREIDRLRDVVLTFSNEKEAAERRIDELQRVPTGAQYDADSVREELSRLKLYRGLLPPTDPTGKSPGEVYYEAYSAHYGPRRQVPFDVALPEYEHLPLAHREGLEAGALAVLRAFGGQNITDPTKPTKPLVIACGCGMPNGDHGDNCKAWPGT